MDAARSEAGTRIEPAHTRMIASIFYNSTHPTKPFARVSGVACRLSKNAAAEVDSSGRLEVIQFACSEEGL